MFCLVHFKDDQRVLNPFTGSVEMDECGAARILFLIIMSTSRSGPQRTSITFSYVLQSLTWNDAFRVCRERGGYLAEPVDEATNNALGQWMMDNPL